MHFKRILIAVMATLALAGVENSALAAGKTWDNGSGNLRWDAGSVNWSGSAWVPGDDAVFGAAGVGSITVIGSQMVGTGSETYLTFNTAGYTLTNGVLVFPGGNTVGTLAVNASATIASLISSPGSGALQKSGAGTLTLNTGNGNTNSTGNLAVNQGSLNVTSGALNVTVEGGATGGGNGPGLIIHGGTLTVTGGTVTARGYVSANGGGTLVINSGVFDHSTGWEFLNGYAGTGTIILNGGLLKLNVLRVSQGDGVVNLNGGVIQLNRFNNGDWPGFVYFNGATVQAVSGQGDFLDARNTYRVQAGGAVFNTAGQNITINAPLLHDVGLGTVLDGGVVKQGAGTLVLGGTNSYTGATVVNAGTLRITQPTLATNNAVTVASNAVLYLDFPGTNVVTALTLGGVAQPAGMYSAANQPGYLAGSGYLLNAGGSVKQACLWSGAVNGNWNTTTTNWTRLPGGQDSAWAAGSDAIFGGTGVGTVTVVGRQTVGTGSGTPLTFNAAGYTLNSGTLVLPDGAFTNTAQVNADVTINTSLLSSNGLVVQGGKTLTLGGSNQLGGSVKLNSGVLVLNNQYALGRASATVADGTEILAGANLAIINPLTISGAANGAALQFAGNATWSGPITLAGDASIGAYSGGGAYALGPISGIGNLTFWVGGASASHVHTFTLNSACSYSGETAFDTFAASAVVVLSGGANTLPTNTVLNLKPGFGRGSSSARNSSSMATVSLSKAFTVPAVFSARAARIAWSTAVPPWRR